MTLNGRTLEVGRIDYQYPTRFGTEITKTRIEYADGHKRFELPKGTKIEDLLLFNGDLLDARRFAEEPVFIVEGEKTANILVAAGYCAVSFCGGASQRRFGEAAKALKGRHAIIWPDSDKPGIEFAYAVYAELQRIGAASITVIEPVWGGEKGTDAADLLDGVDPIDAKKLVSEWVQHTIDIEVVVPATSVEMGIAISAALMAEPVARRWIVEELVPAKWPTLLYGDGGVGKSTAATHLACCVAIGRDWHGRQTYPCPVLFADAEMDDEEFGARVWPVARGLDLDRPPATVYYWRIPKALSRDDVRDHLFLLVERHGIGFIIVDSLTLATHLSDQNAASDISQLIFEMTKRKVATMFLDHHARQPGMQDDDARVDPYGSVMKRNLARSSIFVGSYGEGLVRFRPNKVSFTAKWEPFVSEVRFLGRNPVERITYGPVAANDPRVLSIKTKDESEQIMEAIQDLMENGGMECVAGAPLRRLKPLFPTLTDDALRMRCNRLVKQSRLVKTGNSVYAIPFLLPAGN